MIESLVAWLPILLLIVVWIYFMRKAGAFVAKENMKQQLAQLKLLNEKLDRIATLLDKPGNTN